MIVLVLCCGLGLGCLSPWLCFPALLCCHIKDSIEPQAPTRCYVWQQEYIFLVLTRSWKSHLHKNNNNVVYCLTLYFVGPSIFFPFVVFLVWPDLTLMASSILNLPHVFIQRPSGQTWHLHPCPHILFGLWQERLKKHHSATSSWSC